MSISRHGRPTDRPGLYCVEMRTEQWQVMVQWYREVLGLRVLVRVVDEGYALLEAGDTRLAILARASAGDPSPRISLAFEVTDVPLVAAKLRGEGCIVTFPTRDPEGLREAETTDPDNNRIRVFCWPREH